MAVPNLGVHAAACQRGPADAAGWATEGIALRKQQLDPEPFTIVTGIAGIIGGFAGAVSLFRTFAPVSLKQPHRQTIAILERTIKTLTEIERAVEQMERAVATGMEVGPEPFWLGSRVFLVPAYFTEYTANADRVMRLLRQVLKATHQLERRVSILPYVDRADMRDVVDLQVKIEDVLHGRNRHATETLQHVPPIVARARSIAEELRRELQGGHVT